MATHERNRGITTTTTSTTAIEAMLPPLLVAVAVCASHAACAPLEHVARLIDSFLDPSPRLSLENAVASDSVRLLKRVLHHSVQDTKTDVFLTQLRMRKVMEQAATRGEMAMVELLHAHHPQFLAANALALAAKRGDLGMIQWLETHRHDESIESIPEALIAAAEKGHLVVVRYLIESYDHDTPSTVYCPSDALQNAIENGHMDVVEYLVRHGVRSDLRYAGDTAALNGHLSAVQWLHAMRIPEAFTSAAIPAAAKRGHLEIVRFLHENRTEGSCRFQAMDNAASGGFLDVVEFLHANRTEGSKERIVIGAAQNGHVHILQWLHTHLPLTLKRAIKPTTVAALAHGQEEVLVWLESTFGPMPTLPRNAAETVAMADNLTGLKKLHELQGLTVVWSSRVLDIAASQGNVEMIQWLHEHRPDMHSTEAMDVAAERGHFEIVKLLHDYGMAECTPSTLVMAAGSGNLAMVQWVDAHCTVESNVQAAMDEAAMYGHLAVVQWFHDHHQYHSVGCTTEAMDRAALRGELEMVIWLHNNRSEGCTTSALDGAAAANRWEVVQWLASNRSEGATQDGMDDAAIYQHLKIVSLLHDRYGLRMSEAAVLSTARAGWLIALQWAYSVQPEMVDLAACRDQAAEYGRFHVVDWIDDTLRGCTAAVNTE